MIPTHAWSMNGGKSDTELQAWDDRPEDEIRRLLGRLNKTDRYSFLLWRLPADRGLGELTQEEYNRYSSVYMQCAGDFAGRMTCEIRELVDGKPHQYVLGRVAEADDGAEADQIVPWNDHVATVRPNEVLSGEEVADLFVHYYRTGMEAPGYSRRELDL
jgi:hypothetical protein